MRCSARSAIRTIGYSDYKSFIWILTESHACSAPRAFTKVAKTPRKFGPWFEFELDGCESRRHLARLQREKFVTRQGRHLVVQVAGLQKSIGHAPNFSRSIRVTNVKNRSSRNVPEVASTHRSTRLKIVGLSSPGNRWHAWPHALMDEANACLSF